MSPIIGNAIVIVILAVILFFAGRSTLRTFKNEVSGKGCAGCSGKCSCSNCGCKKK